MQHSVKLNNDIGCHFALIDEDNTQVASISRRRVVGETENWIAVRLGISPLIDRINMGDTNAERARASNRSGFTETIKSGDSLDAAALYSMDDTLASVTICDGRDRLETLRTLGAVEAVVMVPASQKELFEKWFPIQGAEQQNPPAQ